MATEDVQNVPELDELSEGNKETQTIEEQAAKIKEGEPGEEQPAGDKPAGEKPAEVKPPTAEEHTAVLAELKRVRKLKTEGEDKLNATNERVAKMEGKLEAGGGEQTAKQKLAKYDDRALVKLQMQWEDERDTARAGDDATALSKAKANIEAVRLELHERSTSQAAKASEDKTEEDAILAEARQLIEDKVAEWPDLADEDSDIFKAAAEEFKKYPKVYRQLGVFADMVAVASAAKKNPALLGKGTEKAGRKELTKELTKAAEKAIHAGGGGTGVKPSFDVEAMSSDEVEAMAEKIKAGGSLTK